MATKKKIESNRYNDDCQTENENDISKPLEQDCKCEKRLCSVTKTYGDTIVFVLDDINVQTNVKGCKIGSSVIVTIEPTETSFKILSVELEKKP